MNVFVLTAGRTGSTTFAKACKHINNFTAAHESKVKNLGSERINFNKNHIEVDNRLCWFLGRIDKTFGDEAFYVFLKRNKSEIAKSYAKRWFQPISIMRAYQQDILFRRDHNIEIAEDYVTTIEENVEHFLKDKSNKMIIELENIENDFKTLWQKINAEGNLDLALQEFSTNYNASSAKQKINIYDKLVLLKEKVKYFFDGIIHLFKYM